MGHQSGRAFGSGFLIKLTWIQCWLQSRTESLNLLWPDGADGPEPLQEIRVGYRTNYSGGYSSPARPDSPDATLLSVLPNWDTCH